MLVYLSYNCKCFQAKSKYEKEVARQERAARQGEGTWMLDSASQRIAKEEKVQRHTGIFIHGTNVD